MLEGELLPKGDPRRERSLEDLRRLASWMDDVFQIPGVKLRFGLDAILGLWPGLGDAATSAVSLYILHHAARYGVSRLTLTRMAANLALDYVVGMIPFAGDVFDLYWKANQRNMRLLERHAQATAATQKQLRRSDWLFFIGLATGLILLIVCSVVGAFFIVAWLVRQIAAMV